MRLVHRQLLTSAALLFFAGCSDPPDVGLDSGASTDTVTISPLRDSHRGRTLGEWMDAYWRVTLEGGAASDGDVAMLLLPDTTVPGPGGHDTGSREVTVEETQTLALSFYVWLGEDFVEGSGMAAQEPDTTAPAEYFRGSRMHLRLTLDDEVLIDTDRGDSLDAIFFDTQRFDPPIVYEAPTSYGADSAIWVRGLGALVAPLPIGSHTLRVVAFQEDWDVGFDTTWDLTVQ